MSEDQKDPGGASEVLASGESGQSSNYHTSGGGDSVSYETHRKLLAEKKRTAERLAEAEAEAQVLRESTLSAEGKKDELIASLQKRVDEAEKKHKKAVGNYAYKSVASVVEREALKAGCVDAEAFIKLAGLEDLEVDENYNVDPEQVLAKVQAQKQERPFLFQKDAPKIGNHNVKPGGLAEGKTKGVKEMETDDLWAKYAEATGARVR